VNRLAGRKHGFDCGVSKFMLFSFGLPADDIVTVIHFFAVHDAR
jgi:hypothetical protein